MTAMASKSSREITGARACEWCGGRILTGASDYGGYCWGCLTWPQRAAWRQMEQEAGRHIVGDGRAPWEEQRGTQNG